MILNYVGYCLRFRLFYLPTLGTALCSAVIFPKERGRKGLGQKFKLDSRFLRSVLEFSAVKSTNYVFWCRNIMCYCILTQYNICTNMYSDVDILCYCVLTHYKICINMYSHVDF